MREDARKKADHINYLTQKEAREIPMPFEFNFLTMREISLEIIRINSNKSNPVDSIPAKMIKENSPFFLYFVVYQLH